MKLKGRVEELSKVLKRFEKLPVKVVSWLGWTLYLIHVYDILTPSTRTIGGWSISRYNVNIRPLERRL